MGQDNVNRITYDPDKIIKKHFTSYELCMAYNKADCRGKIVRAHTISKKFLKHITEEGHAYYVNGSSYIPRLYNFKLTGLKKLTAFSGFCEYHDNSLFSSFEKNDFDENNKTHIYAMTFRILSREYFYKKCFLDFIETQTKKIDQTGFSESDFWKNCHYHVAQEVQEHYFLYKKYRQKKNVHYLIFKTERGPVATSGIIFPRCDMNGKIIQNQDLSQHGFIFSVFPTKRNTYIILATVNSTTGHIDTKFLNSVFSLTDKELVDKLFSYFFYTADNIVLDKIWYESLTQEIKNDLNGLLIQNSAHYFEENYGVIFKFSDLFNVGKINRIKEF